MMDRDAALAEDDRAALAPARKLREEIRRRGQLDVDLQARLELGQRAQQRIAFRLESQIDVRGALPPTLEHGGGAAGHVDVGLGPRRSAELPRQLAQPLRVNRRTHAPLRARS